MNDINSLPPVPQQVVDAMKRESEKKFGKVPGLDEQPIAQAHLHHTLQQHEEPQEFQEVPMESNGDDGVPENPEPQSDSTREAEQLVQESEQVLNFRAIKEKAKQVERERDEAIKLLKEYTARQQAEQTQPQEEVDTFGMNPDDLVEGKHLSKVAREIKALKQQLDAAQNQSYMTNTEARLKAQFPDLDRVLTPDNIETFKYAYPELAATVDSTKDIYTKAVAAYRMIKKFGVYQEPGVTAEKEIAKKNLAKPRPLTSVAPQQGDSPMSRANAFANGLTKELQEQMWKEMSQARKDY
jgi:hypothetical protein